MTVNVLFIRFSLLLLEFGEVYFEDFTVVFYPLVTAEAIEEKYVHYANIVMVICYRSLTVIQCIVSLLHVCPCRVSEYVRTA